MIWKTIGALCSLSFFITGFSILGDPNCVTAEIGGGRVIGVTCRPDSFGTWSGGAAASIMLLIGTALLAFTFWREIRNLVTSGSQTSSNLNRPSISATSRAAYPTSKPATTKGSLHLGAYAKVGKKMYKQCTKCKAMMTYEWGHCSKCLSNKLADVTEEEMLGMSDLTSVKVCTNCETPVEEMWQLECKQCGETTFVHKQVQVPLKELTPEFKDCPMCAEEIKFAAKKCRFCQHMMEE